MPTTTVSSKAQIVLPAEIRRALDIRPGDRLEVSVEGQRIVLRRAPASDAAALLAEVDGTIWAGRAETLARERDDWDR